MIPGLYLSVYKHVRLVVSIFFFMNWTNRNEEMVVIFEIFLDVFSIFFFIWIKNKWSVCFLVEWEIVLMIFMKYYNHFRIFYWKILSFCFWFFLFFCKQRICIIHKSSIHVPSRITTWKKFLEHSLLFFFWERGYWWSMEMFCENLMKIGIKSKRRNIKSKSTNCFSSIGSNTWKSHQLLGFFWKHASIFFWDNFCSFKKISGSWIVSESLIVRKKSIIISLG